MDKGVDLLFEDRVAADAHVNLIGYVTLELIYNFMKNPQQKKTCTALDGTNDGLVCDTRLRLLAANEITLPQQTAWQLDPGGDTFARYLCTNQVCSHLAIEEYVRHPPFPRPMRTE